MARKKRKTTERAPSSDHAPPPVGDVTAEARQVLNDPSAFTIVGVGASAGGLEAFTALFKALPADTGMGFVLVSHLAPTHISALAEIISRTTAMPVTEVADEPLVRPNQVYVIPPGQDMVIVEGALHLHPRREGTPHRPVDQFLRSLAEDQGHYAIGVILSGTASDGTLGLSAIKAAGGITFAQDDSAQQTGMPHSAIAEGSVDFCYRRTKSPTNSFGSPDIRASSQTSCPRALKPRETSARCWRRFARGRALISRTTKVKRSGGASRAA